MRTAPIQLSAFRPLRSALSLGLLLAATHLQAQDRGRLAAIDARIDQFVTTQDIATGLGGAAPQDGIAMHLSDADRAFLVAAHQVAMFQVHASVAALKKRHAAAAVQSHARRVLGAQQASLVAIEKLGRDQGQELERRFTPEFAERAKALRNARRASFGPVFFGQMLELHARMVALHERASSSTGHAEVRSLVEDSLPTLRTQLADAEHFSTALATVAAR